MIMSTPPPPAASEEQAISAASGEPVTAAVAASGKGVFGVHGAKPAAQPETKRGKKGKGKPSPARVAFARARRERESALKVRACNRQPRAPEYYCAARCRPACDWLDVANGILWTMCQAPDGQYSCPNSQQISAWLQHLHDKLVSVTMSPIRHDRLVSSLCHLYVHFNNICAQHRPFLLLIHIATTSYLVLHLSTIKVPLS